MSDTTKSSASAALRESLLARGFLVLEGRERDFVTLESMLFSAHNPQGDLQLLIFKRILDATWNLQRCREAEIALWKSTNNPALDPLLDDANQRRYERIAKYARQNQINLRRATEDLRAIQRRNREAPKEIARPQAPVAISPKPPAPPPVQTQINAPIRQTTPAAPTPQRPADQAVL